MMFRLPSLSAGFWMSSRVWPMVVARPSTVTRTFDVSTRPPEIFFRMPDVSATEPDVSISELDVSTSDPDVRVRVPDVSLREPSIEPRDPSIVPRWVMIVSAWPGMGLRAVSILPNVAFTWAMCWGSGTTSPPAPVTAWSATPSPELIDSRALTMPIRNPITVAMTRMPMATQTHIQRVRTLVSSLRRGSATFMVVAMVCFLPP